MKLFSPQVALYPYKSIIQLCIEYAVMSGLCFTEQWPSGQGAGFQIHGTHGQKHWVAPRSTQPFILPRLLKWVPAISGNLVVKSKLPPRSACCLEVVESHPQKGP